MPYCSGILAVGISQHCVVASSSRVGHHVERVFVVGGVARTSLKDYLGAIGKVINAYGPIFLAASHVGHLLIHCLKLGLEVGVVGIFTRGSIVERCLGSCQSVCQRCLLCCGKCYVIVCGVCHDGVVTVNLIIVCLQGCDALRGLTAVGFLCCVSIPCMPVGIGRIYGGTDIVNLGISVKSTKAEPCAVAVAMVNEYCLGIAIAIDVVAFLGFYFVGSEQAESVCKGGAFHHTFVSLVY